MSARDHFAQIEKTLGRPAKDYPAPIETPEELIYLWEIFHFIKSDNPISYSEIKAYSELTDTPLDAFEVEIIKTLDRILWRLINARYRKTANPRHK